MSEPESPPLEDWRPLTSAERDLVTLWLAEWNAATGDDTQLAVDAVARTSCACGKCATFDVNPLELPVVKSGLRPFDVGGEATSEVSGEPVGLVVFESGQTTIFEAFPHTDAVVDLAALKWEFYTTKTLK